MLHLELEGLLEGEGGRHSGPALAPSPLAGRGSLLGGLGPSFARLPSSLRLEDEDRLGELFAEPPALAPILPAPAPRLAPAPPLTGTDLPSLLRSGSAFALGGVAHPAPLGDCGLLACEDDLGADLTNRHALTPPRAAARSADAASSPQLLPRTAGGPPDSPPLGRLGPLPSAPGPAAATALAPTWHSQQVAGTTQHLATSSRRQLGPPAPTSAAIGLGLHDAAPMPRPPKGGGLPAHRARAARAEAAVAPSNASVPRQPPLKAGAERQAAPGLTGPAAATPASSAGRAGGGVASSAGRAGGGAASSGAPARSVELTLDVLEARGLFDMPLQQAARELGVGVTTLKKLCRKHNIARWPYRKRSSLDRLISSTQELFADDPQQCSAALAKLEAERESLRGNAGSELGEGLKRYRQSIFKLEYKVRRLGSSGGDSDASGSCGRAGEARPRAVGEVLQQVCMAGRNCSMRHLARVPHGSDPQGGSEGMKVEEAEYESSEEDMPE